MASLKSSIKNKQNGKLRICLPSFFCLKNVGLEAVVSGSGVLEGDEKDDAPLRLVHPGNREPKGES